MQNPDDNFKILGSVFLAGREVYPVVRIHVWIGKQGGMIQAKPSALLIREDERWFFASVDDMVPDILTLISILNIQTQG